MYENNRELLGLCYDSVTEIRDGFYLVVLDGKFGVVDAGNHTWIDLEYIDGVVTRNKLYLKEAYDLDYIAFDIKTFKKTGDKLYSIQKFDDGAWLISDARMQYGLMNSDGENVLPCMYCNIYIAYRTSSHVYLNVKTHDMKYYYEEPGDMDPKDKKAYVIVDKNYQKADCLFAEETGVPNIQKVAVGHRRLADWFGNRLKYSLRIHGKVLNCMFDDILVREALKVHNLFETYTLVGNHFTKGYIDVNGNEIVPTLRYTNAEYIGNRVFWVKTSDGYGTYKDGQEVIPVGTIDNINILRKIPITYTIKDGLAIYIGNDGHGYSNIAQAFPIYKHTKFPNINKMNLYGNIVYIDNEFNRLMRIDTGVINSNDWVQI